MDGFSDTPAVPCVPISQDDLQSSCDGPRRISILGATGSIGQSTLDLVRRNRDAFQVVALTANENTDALAGLAREFDAEIAAIANPVQHDALTDALAGTGCAAASGGSGVTDAAARPCDWTMASIVGIAGLRPTMTAMSSAGTLALANKECLVSAGSVFTRAVQASETTLIPVDSEHSAGFQAIDRTGTENIETITLTASGGPFREWPTERIANATVDEALKHPKWSMGRKVSIDSATLMNKGLEVIEAYHLFPVEASQLDVIVHPQSTIHCLVSYCDGSVLAHLGAPDMRTPIGYSLAWPRRMETPVERLDLVALARLDFEAPDPVRFPCLQLARDALATSEMTCTVLNAANEVAVARFLDGGITMSGIARVVETTLDAASRDGLSGEMSGIDAVYELDREARAMAQALL